MNVTGKGMAALEANKIALKHDGDTCTIEVDGNEYCLVKRHDDDIDRNYQPPVNNAGYPKVKYYLINGGEYSDAMALSYLEQTSPGSTQSATAYQSAKTSLTVTLVEKEPRRHDVDIYLTVVAVGKAVTTTDSAGATVTKVEGEKVNFTDLNIAVGEGFPWLVVLVVAGVIIAALAVWWLLSRHRAALPVAPPAAPVAAVPALGGT